MADIGEQKPGRIVITPRRPPEPYRHPDTSPPPSPSKPIKNPDRVPEKV